MPPVEPRVSIIVRTKDRPLLLARALDDLAAQTYPGWEAIVVNDGGAPGPVDELLAEHAEGLGERFRVIHHETSLGMEAASNRGIAHARGAYVVIHDDDDTWAPAFLERTAAALDADDALVAVAAATDVVVERIEGDRIVEQERWRFGPPGDVVTVFDLLSSNRVVPIGLLIRRTALDALGGFDETLPVVGDWEFNLRLALSGPIVYLGGEALAYWHQRPDASGVLTNSVFGANDLHFRFDRLVRDRALRADLAEHGLGTALFLTKLIDERFEALEQRLRDDADRRARELVADIERIVHGQVQYHSPAATARRVGRRFFHRR